MDFAVLDEDTKPTVHAVLELVHPESISIFKFDQDTPAANVDAAQLASCNVKNWP